MTDSQTFSAVVDDVVSRTGRIDRKRDIAAYANSVIRETQALGLFNRDLIEDQLTATADPFIWTRPDNMRRLKAVNYGEGIYPKFRPPGRLQKQGLYTNYLYYSSDDYFVFKGMGSGNPVNVAYYTRSRRFIYTELETARGATFNPETETWTYLTAVTDQEKEDARKLVTNWVCFHYFDLVCEGTMSRLFKVLGDPKRSVSSFALYKELQKDVLKNEVLDAVDVTGDGDAG